MIILNTIGYVNIKRVCVEGFLSYIHELFLEVPLLALFITIASGYFIGKFKFKTFILGGIIGSLIMGVLIGQIGVQIDPKISSFFFALFIYAVGYQGGAQFFSSLNKKTLMQLISATITCILGLLCVVLSAWAFNLDTGTAIGLGSGGLTQSAMIGSAVSAITRLQISQSTLHAMQANIAIGYAICYIIGSFGPVILLATIIPGIMKWNIRDYAVKLAKGIKGSSNKLEPGQFEAINQIVTRVYKVTINSPYIGKSIQKISGNIAIEAIVRNGEMIDFTSETTICDGDEIAITADVPELSRCSEIFGPEIERPEAMRLIEEVRRVVVTSKKFHKKTIRDFYNILGKNMTKGVFFNSISRLGEVLQPKEELCLHKGDEVQLIGKSSDLNKVSHLLGYAISEAKITDFIFFGIGMSLGFIFGTFSFTIFGVSIEIGNGVGCLLAGLIFGWIRSTHPRYAALPLGASNFLKDFGLATFVATIGITAGPNAITAIKLHGTDLLLLGIIVTFIPQILSFLISYYLLRIKNPIEILATIAGGRSANPGFAAILEKAGNSTPVVPFTAAYTIANIWLTLWGPVIVALVSKNPV